MGKTYFTEFSISEEYFFVDYFTQHIAEYKLSELTNGHCGDIPSINTAHPLALEYGNALNSEGDNFTSMLPAIGVELTNDSDNATQPLGRKTGTIEVVQSYLDEINSISAATRYKNGALMPPTNLTTIQNDLTAKVGAGEKLYAKKMLDLQSQTLVVSVWSYDFDLTKLLYLVTRSLLKRIKRDASIEGVKNMRIVGNLGLYNFDFSQTLFGGEFNIDIIQSHSDIEVDTAIGTINDVELYAKDVPVNKDKAGLSAKQKT